MNDHTPNLRTKRNKSSESRKKEIGKKEIGWPSLIISYFLVFFVLEFIEEKFFLHLFVPVILGSAGFQVFIVVLTALASILVNHKIITRLRSDSVSLLKDLKRVAKGVCHILCKSTFFTLVLMVAILIYAPAALAQYRFTERAAAGIEAGVNIEAGVRAFIDYDPEKQEEEGKKEEEKAGEAEPSEKTDGKEEMRENKSKAEKDSACEVDEEWFTALPESEQKFARELQIPEGERDIIYTLSEEEYNELFFLDGEYKINDWEDPEEVEAKVRSKVRDLTGEQKENIFDGKEGAPASVQNEVDEARKEEENSDELKVKKQSLTVRINAYQYYPKLSLAMLIAETYNGFGLAYYRQCGNVKTSQYYFGQAIQWQFECLTFKTKQKDMQRNTLRSIEQRYRDIAFVGKENQDEIYYYSRKLEDAFDKVRAEY